MRTKIRIDTQTTGVIMTDVEEFILDSSDIANGYITLTYTPVAPEKIRLFITHAPGIQRYEIDFVIVNNNQLTWTTPNCISGMQDVLEIGDRLIVVYERIRTA